MGREFKLSSPLVIERARSKPFALNLNIYRNTHYQSLNSMKVKYKELMAKQIMNKLPDDLQKIELTYTLYPKTRRKCDVSNVCCIVDKFFSDCMVELGRIDEDDYDHIPNINYRFGAVDKDNPRVDIHIKEIQ